MGKQIEASKWWITLRFLILAFCEASHEKARVPAALGTERTGEIPLHSGSLEALWKWSLSSWASWADGIPGAPRVQVRVLRIWPNLPYAISPEPHSYLHQIQQRPTCESGAKWHFLWRIFLPLVGHTLLSIRKPYGKLGIINNPHNHLLRCQMCPEYKHSLNLRWSFLRAWLETSAWM